MSLIEGAIQLIRFGQLAGVLSSNGVGIGTVGEKQGTGAIKDKHFIDFILMDENDKSSRAAAGKVAGSNMVDDVEAAQGQKASSFTGYPEVIIAVNRVFYELETAMKSTDNSNKADKLMINFLSELVDHEGAHTQGAYHHPGGIMSNPAPDIMTLENGVPPFDKQSKGDIHEWVNDHY